MSAVLNQQDVAYVTKAIGILPRKLIFGHLRIALFKWGGEVKNVAVALVRRRTGTLAKGLKVEVKIPDASYDTRHHGKPARVIFGPKRRFGKVHVSRQLKSGKIKRRIKSVSYKKGTAAPVGFIPISRYAHFDKRYMEAAAATGANRVVVVMEKLSQGLATEASKLYQEQPK